MNRMLRISMWATLAVVLMVAPARSMDDMEQAGNDHAAMAATETVAGESMEKMDSASHDHDTMEGMEDSTTSHAHDAMDGMKQEGAGHEHDAMAGQEGMPAEEHDHTAMMEKAGKDVGIEEKLGNHLADATFLDSEGKPVNLLALTKDIPTLIVPIYYRCPDVCNMLQGSLAEVLPDVALKPGVEYQVVSISFDPRESTKDALRAKKTYIAATQGQFPAEDWKFLTGDMHAIDSWLDSIGYTVKREGGLWAHPVAIIAIAPGGKVVRYLYGSSFLPFDLTMAATEAATGKTGLSIKRMLSFCYNYDPQGRRYVFSILRVSGFAIFGFIGLFVLYLVLSGRKNKEKKAN